eukprot:1158086-Pelagomonas_calceolata.AAC.28
MAVGSQSLVLFIHEQGQRHVMRAFRFRQRGQACKCAIFAAMLGLLCGTSDSQSRPSTHCTRMWCFRPGWLGLVKAAGLGLAQRLQCFFNVISGRSCSA